jgi:intein/homing endonuclease
LSLSVTITATDPGDLRRKLSDMLSSMGVSSAATVVKEYVATVDIEKGDAVKKVDPPTEVLEGEVLEPETGEKTWDYATEIKPAVLKVSAKFGREGVLKLLEPFGVSNAQLIPDAKHSEFMASVEDMLSRDTL